MKLAKYFVMFSVGGWLYGILELLWRGWTHVTMVVLGGLCFLSIGLLGRLRMSLRRQLALGVAICTAGELIFGLIFNRDHRIWDYRRMPGNLWGQICPQFIALWVGATWAAIHLYRWCDRALEPGIPNRFPS